MSNGNFNTLNVKQLNFTGNHILKKGEPTMLAVLDASGVGHHKKLCVDNLAVGKGDNNCIDLNYVLDVSGTSKLSGFINDSNGTNGTLGQVITATATGWAWQDPSSGTVTVNNKWKNGYSAGGTSTIYNANPSYPLGSNLARVGIGNFSGTTDTSGQAKATLDVDSGTFTESMRSTFKLGTGSSTTAFQNAPFSAMMGDNNSLNGVDTSHGSSFVLGHSCTLTGWSCAAIGRHNVVNMPSPGSNYGSKGAIALGNYAYAGIKGAAAGIGDIGFAIGTGDEGTIAGEPTYSSNNNKFVIDISGNVGIGLNNPVTKLAVSGTSTNPTSATMDGAISQGIFRLNGTGGVHMDFGFQASSPYAGWIQTHNGTTNGIGDDLLLQPISGNVGIGTNAPQVKLDVSGGDALINDITVGRGGSGNNTNTAVGSNALNSNSTGSSNTATGFQALKANTASFNTATGLNALVTNTSGSYNVATGSQALEYNTTGGYNVATGHLALNKNTSGLYNVAIGSEALENNTTSNNNTAIGYKALNLNTSGNGNVATGTQALQANTIGIQNVAIGNDALKKNESGNYNVATGSAALEMNINGGNNIATGWAALNLNTSGSSNVAIGHEALYSNSTASNNVATGFQALFTNSTGSNNVATGFGALYYNTASGNTAIGYESLKTNTSGTNNVAVGFQTLYTQTNSSSNTGIGYQALYKNTGGDNTAIGAGSLKENTTGNLNTAVGHNSLNSGNGGSNCTAVGANALLNNNQSDNVAVGVGSLKENTSGTYNTAVGTYALRANQSSGENTAVGYSALLNNTGGGNTAIGNGSLTSNTTGVSNTAVGKQALQNNGSGDNNVAIGYNSGPTASDLSNTISIGANVTPANSNSCVIGDGNIKVGINTNAPTKELDVSGNANISGDLSVSLINTSAGPSIFNGKVQINHGPAAEASLYIQNGTVGIGTYSPGEKLEVNGNVKATTFVGNLATTSLTGLITNAQLANSSVSFGGVSVALGASDATPAFDLSDAFNYPTSSLSGTITNAQLAGSIETSKLLATTVSFGGVSVGLGGSDATPAFNLIDATGLPISTGVAGLAANVATFLSSPSSANLAAAVTDEIGTAGSLVFSVCPNISDLTISGTLNANGNGVGSSGQVLSSTGTGLSWVDTTWTTTTGGIYYDSGKVGIGTNDPQAKLHIKDIMKFISGVGPSGYDWGAFSRFDPPIDGGINNYGLRSDNIFFGLDHVNQQLLLFDSIYQPGASGTSYELRFAARGTHTKEGTTYQAKQVKFVFGSQDGGADNFEFNGGLAIGKSTDGYIGTSAPANGLIVQNNVGIGITSPGAKLDVDGDIRATGDIISNVSSDIHFKANINKIENPLEKISKINGYTYDWIQSDLHPYNGSDTGVIAQEVETMGLPGMVVTRSNGYKGVKYERLIPLLLESIKSLQETVTKQQEQINQLMKKIN